MALGWLLSACFLSNACPLLTPCLTYSIMTETSLWSRPFKQVDVFTAVHYLVPTRQTSAN